MFLMPMFRIKQVEMPKLQQYCRLHIEHPILVSDPTEASNVVEMLLHFVIQRKRSRKYEPKNLQPYMPWL